MKDPQTQKSLLSIVLKVSPIFLLPPFCANIFLTQLVFFPTNQTGSPDLFNSFWQTLTHVLQEELANAAKSTMPACFAYSLSYYLTRAPASDSSPVENAFVGEYPKLLRLFNEFLRRLKANYEMKRSNEQAW